MESYSEANSPDESSPNRVRFSTRLVTAIETRPRTHTEEKPNLYWTANEISFLRRQQQSEKKSAKKRSSNHEEERDHNVSARSLNAADVTCKRFSNTNDAKDGGRRRRRDRAASDEGSSETIDAVNNEVEEESGPHLLGHLEWMELSNQILVPYGNRSLVVIAKKRSQFY